MVGLSSLLGKGRQRTNTGSKSRQRAIAFPSISDTFFFFSIKSLITDHPNSIHKGKLYPFFFISFFTLILLNFLRSTTSLYSRWKLGASNAFHTKTRLISRSLPFFLPSWRYRRTRVVFGCSSPLSLFSLLAFNWLKQAEKLSSLSIMPTRRKRILFSSTLSKVGRNLQVTDLDRERIAQVSNQRIEIWIYEHGNGKLVSRNSKCIIRLKELLKYHFSIFFTV